MRPLGFPVAGYIELHIEQGPSLEREGIPIGIVEGIQGTRWLEVAITGQAAHAGTTALAFRRDAMAAAVRGLDRLYAGIMPGDERARFTVGRLSVEPGAVNAIPEKVSFTVDLRHPDESVLEEMEKEFRAALAATLPPMKLPYEEKRIWNSPAVKFAPDLIACVRHGAETAGFGHREMVSGAGHDAAYIARVAPTTMIFVPCEGGLSHNEAESTSFDECAAGAQVLLNAVIEHDRQQAG